MIRFSHKIYGTYLIDDGEFGGDRSLTMQMDLILVLSIVFERFRIAISE